MVSSVRSMSGLNRYWFNIVGPYPGSNGDGSHDAIIDAETIWGAFAELYRRYPEHEVMRTEILEGSRWKELSFS